MAHSAGDVSSGQTGSGSGLLGWCRRHPVVAALMMCCLLQTVAFLIFAFASAARIAELRRENEELRKAVPVHSRP
jgi:uncharacterized integral membrane protein